MVNALSVMFVDGNFEGGDDEDVDDDCKENMSLCKEVNVTVVLLNGLKIYSIPLVKLLLLLLSFVSLNDVRGGISYSRDKASVG